MVGVAATLVLAPPAGLEKEVLTPPPLEGLPRSGKGGGEEVALGGGVGSCGRGGMLTATLSGKTPTLLPLPPLDLLPDFEADFLPFAMADWRCDFTS
jgi:hypothetical protein